MFKEKNIVIIGLIVFILAVGGFFYFSQSRESKEAVNNKNENIDEEAVRSGMVAENKELRKVGDDDHLVGNINAPIQLIVYSDFSCSFCAEFDKAVKQAQQEFGDKLAVAHRHFFLHSSARALPAALASECAAEQGKFWEMHDKLFSRNENDYLGENLFKKYAKEISLDENKFSECLSAEKYKEKILSQVKEAGDFGVIGTPTSFLNGKILPGAYQFEDFIDSQGVERKGLKSLILNIFE